MEGYSDEFDRISVEGVLSCGLTLPEGIHIQILETTTSTNDVAKQRAAEGAAACTVVLAEQQTRGKGRLGRQFYSPPASGVYLSMILRPKLRENKLMLLTTAVAVASTEAIEAVRDCTVLIKWVNDLYLHGKKIAGILVEAGPDYAVVGIGVNVRPSVEGFPLELAGKAGALCESHESISRNRLAAELIARVWETAQNLEDRYEATSFIIAREARRRSCVLGREVLIRGHSQLTRARAVDIDPNGFLIVRDSDGQDHVLFTGEISLDPGDGLSW